MPPANSTDLHLVRVFQAPRERVFDAWTNPKSIAQWFGCPKSKSVEVLEMSAVPGGQFRIAIVTETLGRVVFCGEYLTVARPHELSYLMWWAENPAIEGGPKTTVRLTFRAVDGAAGPAQATELTLVQSGFADAESAGNHNQGWMSTLEKLDAHLLATELVAA